MNILIVVPSLVRAGAETQAVDLANGMSELNHRVHLCTFESQLEQRARLSGRVQFHHMRRRRRYDKQVVSFIANILDEERIDVAQGVLQFATFMTWRAQKQAKRRVPLVAAVHTTVNRNLKIELQDRLVYRRMMRRLQAIIFVCEHQKTHWVRKFPEVATLAHVVYNGIDLVRFNREQFQVAGQRLRKQLAIPDHAFVFACVAAFRPEKSHELLIRAFGQLPANSYLVLAGDGPTRPDIERLVRASGLENRTRFIGKVPDVRPVIAASSAGVLSSTAVETFSIAMLECMAMSTPMVAPDIGGLSEAIIDGETGLLFSVGDVRGLAHQMRLLAENPAHAAALGIAARRLVSERFTLQQMVHANEQLLLSSSQAMSGGDSDPHRGRVSVVSN